MIQASLGTLVSGQAQQGFSFLPSGPTGPGGGGGGGSEGGRTDCGGIHVQRKGMHGAEKVKLVIMTVFRIL